MTKGIFITATGTDAGKTFVSSLIAKKLIESGYNCKYYKPVLSGLECEGLNDCEYVIKTSGIKAEPDACVTFAFRPAVSPHLAAELISKPITLPPIIDDFKRYDCDYLITEGAGGIICPVNMKEEKILLTDVIKALGLDILIIAPAGLGTINSTILTVEYARQQNINIKGIILNKFDENNLMHIDNKKCIEQLTGVKVITTVRENEKDLNIDEKELLDLFKEI